MINSRWLTWGAWIASVMLVMGCASPAKTPAVGTTGADLITDSDEPELRKRARIRTELASGYFEQGKTTVALDEIKQAVAIDPTYAPAFNLRGLAYMKLGEWGLAKESLGRAVGLNPRDADAAHNLGWLHCQLKEFADADRYFGQALAVPGYGGVAKTLMAQGVCQARAGNSVSAEKTLTRAFELDPANPVVSFNLAQVLYKRGDLSRAQFHLHRLNAGPLANAETLWLGIRVEHQLGNQLGARQLGEQLRVRYPKSKELQAYERGAFNE